MAIQTINTGALYGGSPFSLSQATIDDVSGLVFVSGQIDWDCNSKSMTPPIEEQTLHAMKNIQSVLEEAYSSIGKILQLRVYVRGELNEQMEKIVPVIKQFLGDHNLPSLTGVGVASLSSRNALIEIEAIALRVR